MALRRASPADLPAIEAFLRTHIQSSMFPLANLRDHGLDGDHDRSMSFWLAGDGRITGLVGLTREGMAMPQMPAASAADWPQIGDAIAGRRVFGMAGETMQVRALLPALGLDGRPMLLDADEPAFRLELADLVIPEMPGTRLVAATPAHRALMRDWRAAYHGEVLGTPQHRIAATVEAEIEAFLAGDRMRLLLERERPVAITGFNATLPEAVQLGNVFTPPDLRGRGYARRAVALHLAEARAAGVGSALLFASGDMAVRAYRAVGFRPAGHFTLTLFRDAVERFG